MRGLIFSIYDKEFYSNSRIIQEAKILGIEIELCNPLQFNAELTKSYKFLLIRTTGVYYDDSDLELAIRWQQLNSAPVLNSPTLLQNFRDRPTQYQWAKINKLSPIPTINFEKINIEEAFAEYNSNNLHKKWVVKTWRGNQSRGVKLIKGTNEFTHWFEDMKRRQDFRYIIQPFLDIEAEYRYFFIGESFFNVKKICTGQDQLKLFSGPHAEFTSIKELPDEITRLANMARIASGLDYGAADFALTKEGQVFLMELNTIPGFEKMEKLPGINIAATLVKYIKNKYC
jgi:glutathione synthase/RimK-type ligase-like ATP-grasp enzyme